MIVYDACEFIISYLNKANCTFTISHRALDLVHVFHLYTVTMVGVHTQPEVSHNKVSVYTNTLYEPKAHASDYMPGFRQFCLTLHITDRG